MKPPEPLEFPPRPPRLRFWHILLGGMGSILVIVAAVGLWHWWRVTRQAALVAMVENAGGFVTHYHEYARLPDGDFEYGQGRSWLPPEILQSHPNLCSQVFGVTGRNVRPRDASSRLGPEETERFFRAAQGFAALKDFSIESDTFSGRRVAELPSFRRLQEIALDGEQVADADVSILVQATELRDLSLISPQLTDAALPPLAQLARLKRLTLDSPLITDAGLAQLKLPEYLEVLSLKLPGVTDKGICSLPKLPQLKEIYLWMPVGDAGIIHLTAGGRLERVSTRQARFGDAGLAAIARNSSVRAYLELSGSAVTDAGLQCLANLPSLATLVLKNTSITDAGLAPLAGISNLRRLLLAKTQVTGTGLARLHGLTHLNEIDLSDCPVTSEGLAALGGFRSLKELNLAGTPITDVSCAFIPRPAGPRRLDLSRTKLADGCVPHLMPTTFPEICLDDTALTDVGLLAIAENEGELGKLSVRRTKITAQGILAFRDRLDARGHTCQLEHDIPDKELEALYAARMANQAAEPPPAESGATPP